jgi:hypothetical protein
MALSCSHLFRLLSLITKIRNMISTWPATVWSKAMLTNMAQPIRPCSGSQKNHLRPWPNITEDIKLVHAKMACCGGSQ